MTENYDLGIIGGGVAGSFAALRAAQNHKDKKVVLFELGRPPAKRRRQLEGWLGCLPTGDGKLYPGDFSKVLTVVDGRRLRSIKSWVTSQFESVKLSKLIETKNPDAKMHSKFVDEGFSYENHSYYQWYPESIHKLSKNMVDTIDRCDNIDLVFDTEVYYIAKRDGMFLVSSQSGDIYCKKILLSAGRTGWRWTNSLFRKFGILKSDDKVSFGIKVEIPTQHVKSMNNSHCTYLREDVSVGPFEWNGKVIQEDHADMTIANFRSNEARHRSDNAVFSIISNSVRENVGTRDTDRIAKLAFTLSDDANDGRVGRDTIKSLMKGSSIVSNIPEYQWFTKYIEEINGILPSLISRGYFHVPAIITTGYDVNLKQNLESDIDGLFLAGESAGLKGVWAAASSGAVALEGVFS